MHGTLKKSQIETVSFDYESDTYKNFMVDIISDNGEYSAFIYHKSIFLMWGENNTTFDDFIERVTANIDVYINSYIHDYMND